jgi:hypothetical protein
MYSSGTTGVPECIVYWRRRPLQHLKSTSCIATWYRATGFYHLRLDDVELAGPRAGWPPARR